MTAGDDTRAFSLKRWSRRKLAAARESAQTRASDAAPASVRVPDAAPPAAATPVVAMPVPPPAPMEKPAALPPVESLTIDSDFTGFLRPDVAEGLQRQALKQLFRDPRFNVMDGLDVYVDDYSKPDPIPPELVRELVQGRYIFDPPATRVNARGEVEDVPPDEIAQVNTAAPEQRVPKPARPDAASAQVDPALAQVDPASAQVDPASAQVDPASAQSGSVPTTTKSEPARWRESTPQPSPTVDSPTPVCAPDANKPPPA